MKKLLPQKKHVAFTRKCMLVLFITALFTTGKSQILLDEKFDYPTGNLCGQGEWTRYGTDSGVAIRVTDTSLVYPVYQDEPEGRAVRLRMKEKGEDLQKIFTDEPFTTGTLYVSALIHLKKTQVRFTDILRIVSLPSSKKIRIRETKTMIKDGFL